ncbi:hypothetical protein JTB14_020708 [Gonioctena quinquepunctata]|nr:hypothetical protein JTB14_020708 [Gonioctena quinquepunctata]
MDKLITCELAKMEGLDNYTYEEQQIILQSANRRKEMMQHDQIVQEKHFRIRNNTIQQYFFRMSNGNKRNFIMKLMETITLTNITQILYVMCWDRAKVSIYGLADPETNFIYDKLLFDHDRMLDEKVLAETMKNDITWFVTLEGHFQVLLITDLMRMSSGFVKRRLYPPIFLLFHKKLAALREKQWIVPIEVNIDNTHVPVTKDNVLDGIDEYDPKHPASIEVEKHRKKWADMISKYRAEVEGSSESKRRKARERGRALTKQRVKKLQICPMVKIPMRLIWTS